MQADALVLLKDSNSSDFGHRYLFAGCWMGKREGWLSVVVTIIRWSYSESNMLVVWMWCYYLCFSYLLYAHSDICRL